MGQFSAEKSGPNGSGLSGNQHTGLAELTREVFGPVLHVLRFRRDALDGLLSAIDATGYGLTFGVHSRLDATIARVTARSAAGNVYVNRNLIGAVVGVQPFGGHGLSGTGPKAGGPLYLRRLLAICPPDMALPTTDPCPEAIAFLDWLRTHHPDAVEPAMRQVSASRLGLELALRGPVGEVNRYSLHPRGTVVCRAVTRKGLLLQLAACFATGNGARLMDHPPALGDLPPDLAARVDQADDAALAACHALLVEGDGDALRPILQALAASEGPIRSVLVLTSAAVAAGQVYIPDMLLAERSISVNTTAAGGNATLMSL